ncbi:Anthranilate phosphoribosyltransferase [Glycine soja]
MKVLINNPKPFLSSPNSIFPNNNPRFHLRPFPKRQWIGPRLCLARAALDWATIEQFGLPEFDVRNPALSSSYRRSELPRPNQTVLEAQARVCTGPTQTRPLDEQQAFKVFDLILRSARGGMKDEDEVSKAQLGAFFAGMTIRANAFPEATQWSEGETRAMKTFWPLLVRVLPPEVIFIADPEGLMMGVGSSIGPQYVGNGTSEMRLVGALREVLAGGHLGFEEVQGVLKDVLPIKEGDEKPQGVSEALLSAFLIGQRMNRETDRELKAYCLAFDDEIGPPPVADVRSLTHYGEPYDGNTRFFRSTLFVAAVRSCYGESCLLHGVDWMAPKGGVTEEQMLKFMGANINISPSKAKKLLEDDEVGFAYVSQREARPSLYSLIKIREHIKKRPPLATTEKVQQYVKVLGKTQSRAPYASRLLHRQFPTMLNLEKNCIDDVYGSLVHHSERKETEPGADCGFGVTSARHFRVVLGLRTRLRRAIVNAHEKKGSAFRFGSEGFRALDISSTSEVGGVARHGFSLEVNAKDYGFQPTDTPRTDRSVSKNIELGLAALYGEKGPAYDRIVLNAGVVDHLLGVGGAEDISAALDRAREAIDSGNALKRLLNYIKVSHKIG